jgi:hypothetical protein
VLIEPIIALQCSVSLVTLIRGLAALLDCFENWVIVTWDYVIFCNVPNFSMQERLLCVLKPMNANLLLKLANTVMIFYSQVFLRNLVHFVDWFYSKLIM